MSELLSSLRAVRLILSDVDGVLTDGGIIYDANGGELKHFNARDGFGIRFWEKNGGLFGIVTGRRSNVVELRAKELQVSVLRQGIRDKGSAIEEISQEMKIPLSEIAFIGDDFPDLPALDRVGLPATVADAPEEVQSAAQWISTKCGGGGAVRELIEAIMKAQNKWDEAVLAYRTVPQV